MRIRMSGAVGARDGKELKVTSDTGNSMAACPNVVAKFTLSSEISNDNLVPLLLGDTVVVTLLSETMVPFLKWAGGKRWLFERGLAVSLESYVRHIEPFLGGGAAFFAVQPRRALLSDVNPELINLYEQVRDHPEEIASGLEELQSLHSKDFYYEMRRKRPESSLERAIRTIYLNRTCWNGLYRVNRKGEFNVPIGTKSSVVLDTDDFKRASELLNSAVIKTCDFEETIQQASEGDLVFIDPPYTVKHNVNGFVKYNEAIFTWSDQVRLRDCARDAALRGATVIITNADHSSIRDLYSFANRIESIERSSVISGVASARARTTELMITL